MRNLSTHFKCPRCVLYHTSFFYFSLFFLSLSVSRVFVPVSAAVTPEKEQLVESAATIVMSASSADNLRALEEDRASLEARFRAVCRVSAQAPVAASWPSSLTLGSLSPDSPDRLLTDSAQLSSVVRNPSGLMPSQLETFNFLPICFPRGIPHKTRLFRDQGPIHLRLAVRVIHTVICLRSGSLYAPAYFKLSLFVVFVADPGARQSAGSRGRAE